MSTLSFSNPSPPPHKKSPWLLAGAIVLLCIVGYLLFHCFRPCPPTPPDLTPSALGFSTAGTSGIDGLNHGDLDLPISEKIPITVGLFGQDDSTLVKPDTDIGFKLVLLDADRRPHRRLRLVQSTTGVIRAGNPTASLEIELRWIGAEGVNRSAGPGGRQNDSGVFQKAKFYADELESVIHLAGLGDSAIICAQTYDPEIREICRAVCPGISGPITSTVHITVLGVITHCEGGNCMGSSVLPQAWNFRCLSDPGDITPINPYSTSFGGQFPLTSLSPGSLKMEFNSNLTSVDDNYNFEFSAGPSPSNWTNDFVISDEDHASRMIVSDNHIVHVVSLCNP